MLLPELLRASARTHHDRIALRVGAREWPYSALDEVTDRLAAGLAARGIGRGDRVAFLLPNGAELVFVNLACLKLGAVVVPLNVRLIGPELAYILDHAGARLCIAQALLYQALQPVRAGLSTIEAVFICGDGTEPLPSQSEDFAALLANQAMDLPSLTQSADAPAAILYTSGTTARPKGVTHGVGGLAHTVRHFTEAVGMHADDVVLGMLSMSHVFGYTLQMLAPLSVGGCVVITPNVEPGAVLAAITRHRVTHLYGLPVMFDALCRHSRATASELSSLRYCLAGGDAVSPALNTAMRNMLGLSLHEGCGMTEVIPYALNRPGIDNRVGSIGQPSIGMQLRIVDASGRDVADGESGEVLVRSDALMSGYWNDPAATAAAIRDGWLHTGDRARRDADGYYWFIGRSKEIIVRGGSNISPLEVEAALSEHPAVREVAVVGAPHPTLIETVAAFIALNDGSQATVEELQRYAAARIAAYKVPEIIRFLPALPRGSTGKVQRKALKESLTAPNLSFFPSH